jgi:undecaprenyl-diphosphatase
MTTTILQIIILGLVQGAAELLPVSSSAHVIVAEKLMGLDPASPEMTFLLVMLHTGTMAAVMVYFWKQWQKSYFSSRAMMLATAKNVVAATVATLVVGEALKVMIEKVFMHGQAKAEIEQLFSNLPLIAGALAAAGVLIVVAGLKRRGGDGRGDITLGTALRGFSRSGATISTGLLLGTMKARAEEFSFALAVVLTPPAIVMELHRLAKVHPEVAHAGDMLQLAKPGLLGMGCSFVAGLLALRMLSRVLEAGRWHYFGYYCLAAAGVVAGLALSGF